MILLAKKFQNDPYHTKNDKLYGKLINGDSSKVNFYPRTSDNTLFLFSDGPEEIRTLNTQTLLKYYEQNKEHTLPEDKTIDFEFYHYNNARRNIDNNNIIVGVLLKNESTVNPASFTIYGSSFDTMRIPRTEDFLVFKNEKLRIKQDGKKIYYVCYNAAQFF